MPNHEPPVILLVDDEPEMLTMYRTKLERSGFVVRVAADGAEAVKMAAELKPDLILMDMKMPVMDGVTAQQKIRENPETNDVKVVYLTAFSDPMKLEADMQLAKGAGATDFIKKGINLDELVERVRGYLEKPPAPDGAAAADHPQQ
ncbi:MAG TPA: response regulator [Candidatus Paceibacterota bacterium]|nr:response regulator [Candidatus Paceibacterota bacterium]